MDVSQLVAPISLFLLMSVVGLELTLTDFERVAAQPRAVWLGTLGQITLLPLMSAGLLLLTTPPAGVAAGLVLLVASPGGGISNVLVYLARAHTALSVTLTAVASLLAVVTLPLIAAAGMKWFVDQSVDVEVPVLMMMAQLVLFVLLPVGLGMALRARRPDLAARMAPTLRRVTVVVLVLLLGASMVADGPDLTQNLLSGIQVAAVWTLLALLLGWGTGALARLDPGDRFALAVEFSVKNAGVAAIVAISALQRPDFAVFAGAYVVAAYPLVGLATWAFRRFGAAREPVRLGAREGSLDS